MSSCNISDKLVNSYSIINLPGFKYDALDDLKV